MAFAIAPDTDGSRHWTSYVSLDLITLKISQQSDNEHDNLVYNKKKSPLMVGNVFSTLLVHSSQ